MEAIEEVTELAVEDLKKGCPEDLFDFDTTADLEEISKTLGQDRLNASLNFGMDMDKDGFNIFALGPNETDKRGLIEDFVGAKAKKQPQPDDFCYVNNFDDRYKPTLLTLPAGRGAELKEEMANFIEEVETALKAAFESEEYQNRRQTIEEEVQESQGESFEELQKKARERGLTIMRTPAGFAFAPVKDGDVMSQEEIQQLDEEERKKIEEDIEELQGELQDILRQMPAKKRQVQKRLKELDREIASYAIEDLIKAIKEKFSDLDQVISFLDNVKEDIVENVKQIVSGQQNQLMQMIQQQQGGSSGAQPDQGDDNPILKRYRVNLLVDNSETEGAPVVFEDNPTFKKLIGRVEYKAQMGAFSTDYNLVKAGALHRANGGYLILDIRSILLEPFAWEGLKRVLKSGEIKIENPGESYRMISTVSLQPEPVDLDVKVILLGERMLYYLLCELDPDFQSLFKVEADFEDEVDRTDELHQDYAHLVAGIVKDNDLSHFHREAVARVIEQSARLVGDSEKLSTRTNEIKDLLMEANHWASENGNDVVTADDVQQAIDQQKYRSSRIKDKMQEQIERETVFIDTDGEKVAQINGLSVLKIGNLMFGKPSRITARVQLGKGDIVNIEREVDLSGPIHSKGVLILKGFMGERFGRNRPLAFTASLVFEQSYGGIDGDSASSTELYALLSSISGVPIKQGIAVTGSVNQHGQIQPIGGVNEKIEGFFDICSERGLTGEQGVLIPKANVKNLMLRDDVLEAVSEGTFHIWPVETIDQGMELLTGKKMGVRDESGAYPEDSINGMVASELGTMADQRKEYMLPTNGKKKA